MADVEMVERVALAVKAATSTHIHRPYDMTTCRIIARAAIEALREPTHDMLRPPGNEESVWVSMIDIALEENAPKATRETFDKIVRREPIYGPRRIVEELRKNVIYGDGRLYNPAGHNPLMMTAANLLEELLDAILKEEGNG